MPGHEAARDRWTATLGAVCTPVGTSFRVWAPKPSRVELQIHTEQGEQVLPMVREGEYWSAVLLHGGPGTRYRYVLDGEAFPDPCSRRQPDGVHGPSAVVAPDDFAWGDQGWSPPAVTDLSVYECHIGTLTPEGTFDAAIPELRRIRDLGFTAVEVMPVASFAGRWNWGYDGVALYAPAEVYGGPDGLRRFVDAAHGIGLAVVLDLVYNHFGPDGNYTGRYSEHYVTQKHSTIWGDALNFDDVGSQEVRRFFTENALHWVYEYHADGFRFDATFGIQDSSDVHFLAELSETLECHSRNGRRPYLFAETHENDPKYMLTRDKGGYGWDGCWADDFHHIVRTLITGEREGYYANYGASDDELGRVIAQGFFYEGQPDRRGGQRRGHPAREQPWYQFVYTIQNHDQIGNRAFGQRLNVTASHADFLAASLLLLLLPQSPLVFQGQEFLASTPFLYFTDHDEELGKLVTEGRREEFGGFAAFSDPHAREAIPDPQAPVTFERSKLDLDEAQYGAGLLCTRLYAELLRLRMHDPALRAARTYRSDVRAESQGKSVVVSLQTARGKRAIVANLGDRAERALPDAGAYSAVVHTGEPRWGGNGDEPRLEGNRITIPPHSAAFLALKPSPAEG
ncbi:MAG: malto-oligosyltrehalose trehalohydrolase [Chloroflexota bacterium]|nr:malto-oligosyltrehalose trehalohydrolase [Chloroflexota bacterium]